MLGEQNSCTHRFEGFRYDAYTGELRKGEQRTRLSPHLASLLQTLIDHPGELVSRETLRAQLWPAETFVDFEHGLTVALNKLRQALGDSSHQARFIETIPRRGYRWLVPVEQVNDTQAQAAELPEAPRADPRLETKAGPLPRSRVALGFAPGIVLVVISIVAAGIGWVRLADRAKPDRARPAADTISPPADGALPDAAPADAQDAYVKGRLTPSSASISYWRTKVEYLRLAIRRAPRFASAHAELARAYTSAAWYGFAPVGEALQAARTEALEAVRLDEHLALGHVALGDVRFAEWDESGADSEYERALELEPGNEQALQSRAYLLMYKGQFDRAIALWSELADRDPVDPGRVLGLATAYTHARRFDAALHTLRRLNAERPLGRRVRVALAVAYAGKGECTAAVREAERSTAVPDSGNDDVTMVAAGWVYARCGRLADARIALRRYESPDRLVAAEPISLAALYGALGETEQGIRLIERGVNEHSPLAMVLDVDMMLDSLRTDTRFEPLAAQVRDKSSGSRPAVPSP